MKKTQCLILLSVVLMMGYSAALHAEDTDIYVDNAANDGVPNVLFVMDNGANFSANAKIGCSFYPGTTEAPSLGTTTGAGIEQCALVSAIEGLPDGAVNIGILVSNANKFANDVRSIGDTAYHELCDTDTGGCLIRKLTFMDGGGKENLIKFIKSWKLSAQNSATEFGIKVNTATPATMMQEAWAYYRGKIGMSGKSYGASLLASGCQKNFIVYIANGEKGPAIESGLSPYDGPNALTSAQVGATAAQKLKISEVVKFVPKTCRASSISPGTQSGDWSENWADEWARLMYQQDGGATTAEGAQNIITYSIAVVNEETCTPEYPALMTTMAEHGGGKYFKTSTATEIATALAAILNEVQATNSVFSSASLPVSVNAEGSYLNQIYLGMFRPDAAGSPRWLGNLKQYQLIRNAAGTLVLGDAQAGPAGPQPAISSAGTGFISPNAVSFWTSINPAKEPDDVGGFYRFDPKGVPPTGYDSPDGEVVEKGGVAQQVRLENLFADFGATAGSSANPRRLYTYCPRGSNCISDLTDSTNQFSISNLGIGAAAFGGSTPADRDRVIRWFRGEDNFGDEKGPGGRVTVWPSIHGDVLHSRPLVVNYGDSRGIVVFYGANDGVFRAVNGNKTAAISSIPAGGELWGLVLPEHYGSINRLRINSPELKFPSTSLPSARPKDYFIDGATGSYQQLKVDGTIDKAYLFLTMRRGGRMIYALDVSDPTKPAYMWSISPAKLGFGELGQTWSRPRVTLLQRDAVSGTANPVLVFGAGYDPDQDTEPPSKDAMGRGIFVVDARKGELIWSATPSCLTSSTCLNVPGMTHAVPSDIAFVDRDGDGYTDKFYFADLGGNIWRTDVNTSSPSGWIVTKLAALGCNTGICATGTTPRKFFFPPSVLSIKGSGAIGSYDAISIASGDREHPLKSAAPQSSYNVRDRFFMVKDTGTVLGKPETSDVTPAGLFDATSTLYDDSLNGFYKSFAPGEKAVNAPLAVNGSIFYATNRPIDKTQTCAANLGEAKAYAVSPFSGSQVSNVLPGGGLAPSAVTGLITIETTTDGKTTSSEEKFCIGCGISSQDGGAPCLSSLDQCSFNPAIPKNLRRTYWYKK